MQNYLFINSDDETGVALRDELILTIRSNHFRKYIFKNCAVLCTKPKDKSFDEVTAENISLTYICVGKAKVLFYKRQVEALIDSFLKEYHIKMEDIYIDALTDKFNIFGETAKINVYTKSPMIKELSKRNLVEYEHIIIGGQEIARPLFRVNDYLKIIPVSDEEFDKMKEKRGNER